jgi:hypothetical protein
MTDLKNESETVSSIRNYLKYGLECDSIIKVTEILSDLSVVTISFNFPEIKTYLTSNMFWQIPSTMFLGSASAVAAGAMMINLRQEFGTLASKGSLTCDAATTTDCKLGGSFGNGILAINIISIVFNALLFIAMAWKWMQTWKMGVNMRILHMLFTLVSLAVMMAIAASGYNLYVQQNFGSEFVNGNINCAEGGIDACSRIGGKDVNIFMGLNSAAIALSGLVFLSSALMAFDRTTGGVGIVKGSTHGSVAHEVADPFERTIGALDKPFRSL